MGEPRTGKIDPAHVDFATVDVVECSAPADVTENRPGGAPDEVRFIVIHQIDELWFKLVLRELQRTRDLFRRQHVPETGLAAAATSLRRVAVIWHQSRHAPPLLS